MTIDYWDPLGGNDHFLTSWNSYTIPTPQRLIRVMSLSGGYRRLIPMQDMIIGDLIISKFKLLNREVFPGMSPQARIVQ